MQYMPLVGLMFALDDFCRPPPGISPSIPFMRPCRVLPTRPSAREMDARHPGPLAMYLRLQAIARPSGSRKMSTGSGVVARVWRLFQSEEIRE